MSALVRVVREGDVLRVTLDRPDVRNALSSALLDELRRAFTDAAKDATIRLAVLAGEGRDFCAGADLADMKRAGAASPEENRADAARLAAAFRAVHAFPRPVVARVQGNVLGGGNGLVAACDIALCATDARFAFSEVRLGILPAVISPYVLRRIGDPWTRRLFLTGERFGADLALRIGLVSEVAPEAELDAAVAHIADALRLGSPDAQRRVKHLLDAVSTGDLDAASAVTPDFIAEARASAEGQEGLRAFFEKRPPSWAPKDAS
ncbi:MAG: enoyl-CoA hydratase-related protein [Candidatus Eiseniibacteriota bacterium]